MTPGHEQVADRLRRYLENELSPGESEQIRLHLRDCAACRASAGELQELFQLLNTDVSDAPPRPVWPHVEERLRTYESRRMGIVSGLAAAAGLIIAIFIGQKPEQSEWNARSPLGFTLSSGRDTAVVDFAPTATAEEGF